MREIVYRPRAAFDLESIVVYLGEVRQNKKKARQIYDSIREAIQRLANMPTLGQPFQANSLTHKHYRSWLVGMYRVFYSYSETTLTVWRVVHIRQDIDDYAIIEWE